MIPGGKASFSWVTKLPLLLRHCWAKTWGYRCVNIDALSCAAEVKLSLDGMLFSPRCTALAPQHTLRVHTLWQHSRCCKKIIAQWWLIILTPHLVDLSPRMSFPVIIFKLGLLTVVQRESSGSERFPKKLEENHCVLESLFLGLLICYMCNYQEMHLLDFCSQTSESHHRLCGPPDSNKLI